MKAKTSVALSVLMIIFAVSSSRAQINDSRTKVQADGKAMMILRSKPKPIKWDSLTIQVMDSATAAKNMKIIKRVIQGKEVKML